MAVGVVPMVMRMRVPVIVIVAVSMIVRVPVSMIVGMPVIVPVLENRLHTGGHGHVGWRLRVQFPAHQ